jgi:hypothetical protein
VLDLPQDADDEAMMELAIALSLQEQSVGAPGLQLQGLSQGQSSLSLEGGNSSDNTTSGLSPVHLFVLLSSNSFTPTKHVYFGLCFENMF